MPIVMTICALADGNFSTWGDCLLQGAFMNDPVVFIIIMFALFAVIIAVLRLSQAIVLSAALGIIYALNTMFENTVLAALLVLLVIISGVYLVWALLRPAREK